MTILLTVFWAILAIIAVLSLVSISEKLRELSVEAHARNLLLKGILDALKGLHI